MVVSLVAAGQQVPPTLHLAELFRMVKHYFSGRAISSRY
jgi:hypothetical protein